MSLKTDYENICQCYVHAFTKKHDISFDYWIGDDIGGIASFGECYTFSLTDIRIDIDNRVQKGKIFEWIDYEVEFNMNKEFTVWINYKNWLKGARHE
jgi:hypothetical protein